MKIENAQMLYVCKKCDGRDAYTPSDPEFDGEGPCRAKGGICAYCDAGTFPAGFDTPMLVLDGADLEMAIPRTPLLVVFECGVKYFESGERCG